ncbi:MAG: cell division protein SepF [Clostridiales Family XIII bacterium]|jgi:cell division inhibitor SepF|nr:cell division protein SepF [Clostridiales Family XIII bacterium]
MGLFDKIKDLVHAEDEDFYDNEDDEAEPKRSESSRSVAEPRRTYGLAPNTDSFPRREPLREPLSASKDSSGVRDNLIPLPGRQTIEKLTSRFKIVVIEPKAFDECPRLVDSLKARKPVIINLERIENDTARKIFDFLSGATYALGGNVQKIAQNIFVFLPENVDVQANSDAGVFKYGDDSANPWT